MTKKQVNIHTAITGCPRRVSGGACALPAGHGGQCVPISGPTKGGKH